jgi:hypothetical protein
MRNGNEREGGSARGSHYSRLLAAVEAAERDVANVEAKLVLVL